MDTTQGMLSLNCNLEHGSRWTIKRLAILDFNLVLFSSRVRECSKLIAHTSTTS